MDGQDVRLKIYMRIIITKINNMEILIYLAIAVVMGVISYYIWDAKDGRTIKRGDEWD